MIRRLAVLTALAVSLAGCGSYGPRLAGLAPSGEIAAGGVPVTPEHTLTAGDEFEIRLPFAADYNDRVTVGMDGRVAPKGIGAVEIGGLTVPEATDRLKAAYAKVLKAPELSLTMRRFEPQIIYVDGWVQHPGLIRSEIPLTAARAIARAGGMKTGARSGAILVIRHDAGGGVHPYEVGLGSFAGAEGQDPLLKSFDVVYVPQTPVAAVLDVAQQIYGKAPFSASLDLTPTRAPTIVAPTITTPLPTAPAPVNPPR